MALSVRKKNLIIAYWKTGKFKSYYAVAKHYKISQHTVKIILTGIEQSNAHIVELGVQVENMLRALSPIERKSVERVVAERMMLL